MPLPEWRQRKQEYKGRAGQALEGNMKTNDLKRKNLCMSSDERAVPKTRARAELTATACKLPSPSLINIKCDHFDRL